MLKIGSGLTAGAFAGALAVGFWPRIEPAALDAKALVEKPVFMPAARPSNAMEKDAVAKLNAAIEAPATPVVAPTAPQPATNGPTPSPALAAPTTRSAALAAPATPEPPQPETPTAPGEAALRLRAEGLVALAGGDIASARSFLERAADAGDPRALMVLGDTYDPATLSRLGALGLKGDEQTARNYYARALAAGVGAAKDRIAALGGP